MIHNIYNASKIIINVCCFPIYEPIPAKRCILYRNQSFDLYVIWKSKLFL